MQRLPVRVRPCIVCGAPVESMDKFCPACGAEQPAAAAMAEAQPNQVQKHFQCKNCGAEVALDPDRRSYICPFCDSTYVVEFTPEQTGRQSPEFIIGFAVAPDQSLEAFPRVVGAQFVVSA